MKRRSDGRYVDTATITLLNGKKSRKFFYGSTPAEVKAKMLAFHGEAGKGPKFLAVAEAWRAEHVSRVSFKTWDCYAAPYRRITDHFATSYVAQITPPMVNAFIGELSKQKYSLRTVRAHIAALNMIFKHAIFCGYIETNPAAYVKPPSGLQTTKRKLPDEELVERVKASAGLDFGLFAYLLLYTGMRRGEALALKYEDIQFEKSLVRVSRSIYFDNNKPIIKTPKTSAGTRDIVLLDVLSEKLDHAGKGYLFQRGGEPLTLSAFQKRWERYCLEAGLAEDVVTKTRSDATHRINTAHKTKYHMTPHQLRHAFATILFEAGLDEKDTQELLGHASIAMTRDVYTHIRSSRKVKTASLLNEYLAKEEAET